MKAYIVYGNVFSKKTWKRFPLPLSVKLFDNIRHRFTNVTGDQFHVYAFLPSCPTSLTCPMAKLLGLWAAPFVCTEWKVQYLLHKTNYFVKAKFHASCSSAGPWPLLSSCPSVLWSSPECTPALVWFRFLTPCLAQHACGKEQKIPIFPCNVVWWCSILEYGFHNFLKPLLASTRLV